MTIVVFYVPGLWHHPIKPVRDTAPEGSNGELKSVPSALIWVALVVPTMASVMGNHGPSGKGPCGEGHNTDEVYTETHGEKTNRCTEVRPSYNFVQMTYIVFSLLLLQFFSQLADLLSK
mmetsp:Transcript_21555/g.27201  ORF Transcript_21555/g.27201 Transcript_21555/m.27201 type:complete len:119 (-) Transcript_21555:113-469(-)